MNLVYKFPLAYVLYCWISLIYPPFLIYPVSILNLSERSEPSAPPPTPTQFTQENVNDVSQILGIQENVLTPEKLMHIHNSLLKKPTFTLRNAIWMLSILGIVISIIPACQYLYPHVEIYIQILVNMKHVWEALAYLTCMILINVAFNSKYSTMIATTSILLTLPCLYLSSYIHDYLFPSWQVYTFALSSLIPLTFLFHSQLLGFFSVASVFGLVGFQVIPIAGGILMGSENIQTVETVAITSFLMIFVAIWTDEMHFITLFRSGMFVLGTLTYGVSGLILCCPYNANSNVMSIIFPMSLVKFLILGSLRGNFALQTSSFIFILLFFMEKMVEVFQGASWVLLFLASCGIWNLMWYAKSNDVLSH